MLDMDSMAIRQMLPGMGTSPAPAAIRCLCSTGSAIRQFGDPERSRGRPVCDRAQSRRDPSAKHRLPSDSTRRPPTRSYDPHPCGFSHRAGSWDKKRRVVARVERHPGERVPRVGFIVTRLSRPARRVVAFCNRRGRAAHRGRQERDCADPACHAGGSGTLPCGSGFMRSPAIPVTSCGRRVCRRRSGDGRRPA